MDEKKVSIHTPVSVITTIASNLEGLPKFLAYLTVAGIATWYGAEIAEDFTKKTIPAVPQKAVSVGLTLLGLMLVSTEKSRDKYPVMAGTIAGIIAHQMKGKI